MKKLALFVLLLVNINLMAQPIDCSPILEFRQPDPSFTRSEHSKSIQGFTGEKYEFTVPVTQGEQYRFSFFISAILTREIYFKIEDSNTDVVLLNLPGTTKENKRNESVLGAYYDELKGKMIYPFFDFVPKQTTTYIVTIDIAKYKRPKPKYKPEHDDGYFDEIEEKEKEEAETERKSTFTPPEEKRTGCVTMYIQQRKACY